MGQVTSNDVAKAAAVSRVTVSRVLNDHGNVTEEVRRRVLKAAAELGYHTARSRAQLRRRAAEDTGALKDMGFFFHSLIKPESITSNPFWSTILHGAEQEAGKANITVIYRSISSLVSTPGMLLAAMKQMKLGGILLVGSAEAATARVIQQAGIPLILADIFFPDLDVDAVLIDDMEGIRLAMRHLFERGHHQIAYIGGPVTFTRTPIPRTAGNIYSLERRLASYFTSLLEAEIPLNFDLVETGELGVDGGYVGARNLLERNAPFTAIVCANDQTAIGAMKAVREQGLRVPEDISIVGFDDIETAHLITPALTTIQVNKEAMGAIAVRALIARVQDPASAVVTSMLRVKLIERNSVASRIS